MAKELLLCLILISSVAQGQILKRQASFGIVPEAVNADLADELGLEEASGILVRSVFPGGTYKNIGGQEGDVIHEINHLPVPGFQELIRAFSELDLREGAKVEMTIRRNGKEETLSGKVLAKPKEESTGDVFYDEMPFKEGTVRIIATKPKGQGVFPTIYFIPGYNCFSIDNMRGGHPYRQLLDSLSHLGYAIVKVEKPGMGDNMNTGNCQMLGFNNELEAFMAGYDYLKKYDFVDTSNIFIWGHSMGGVIAPLVAKEKHPKGVAVYGTTHELWVEYLLKMIRFQNPRVGIDYDDNEKSMPVLYKMLYEHYYLGKSSKELFKNPEYKTILERDFLFNGENQILYRHEDFWREINTHNLTEAWMDCRSFVLSMWGEADFEALSDQSHKEIIRIVNTVNPGHGEYRLIKGTSHSMFFVGSMEEGIKLKNSGKIRQVAANGINYEIVTTTHQWIQSLIHDLDD